MSATDAVENVGLGIVLLGLGYVVLQLVGAARGAGEALAEAGQVVDELVAGTEQAIEDAQEGAQEVAENTVQVIEQDPTEPFATHTAEVTVEDTDTSYTAPDRSGTGLQFREPDPSTAGGTALDTTGATYQEDEFDAAVESAKRVFDVSYEPGGQYFTLEGD